MYYNSDVYGSSKACKLSYFKRKCSEAVLVVKVGKRIPGNN